MPGPIVAATVTLFRYWPFAADGFALTPASSMALKLSVSFSVPKEAFPACG